MKSVFLIDLLPQAIIEASIRNYVQVQTFTINRQPHMTIFQHPDSRITFPYLRLGQKPRLSLACGIKQSIWDQIVSPVEFMVSARSKDESVSPIFQTQLEPRQIKEHRAWLKAEIDLSAFSNQEVQLILESKVPPDHSNAFAWAGWANPVVEDIVTTPRAQAPRVPRHHIFLITATALGAHYMESYGHQIVKTPRVNQLAQEGSLFEQAWAQSITTPGAYTSLLNSHYAHQHGVDDEWTRFPAHYLSLPVFLQSQGYQTALFASETEIDAPEAGFERVFKEVIPCIANPSQSGDITVRRFTEWLEQRPDQACFCWVELFDAHPPILLQEPFHSLYYTGNPEAEHFDPEKMKLIHGVETSKFAASFLGLLEQGIMPAELRERLKDTVTALRDRYQSGPDIVHHLRSLDADARNGLTLDEFSNWLEKELLAPAPSKDLVEWFRKLTTYLRKIEKDIIEWVDGIHDFRYPLAQYMSAITYVDELLGRIIDTLKEQGIYEQSTLIFTSPHGEIIDHLGLVFDHHILHPINLHVPLVIKFADELKMPKGQRIKGVFDAIDLFPTLVEMLGVPPLFQLQGVNRFQNIRQGAEIPPHYSFSSDMNLVAHSVFKPPFLFVKSQGVDFRTLEWQWHAQEERLFKVVDHKLVDQTDEHPALATELRQQLEQWLKLAH